MQCPRFWSRLAGDEAGVDVLAAWRDALGEELALTRPFLVETGALSESWTCGRGREGCARRVHRYDDAMFAACTASFARCDRSPVTAADLSLWRLDRARVLAAVARGLSLVPAPPPPMSDARVTPLGGRSLGGLHLRVYGAAVADTSLCAGLCAMDARLGPGVCVVVTFSAPAPDVLATVSGRGAHLVALSQAATILSHGRIDVNIDDVLLAHRDDFVGLDPSTVLSRQRRLILDYAGGRVWLDHQPFDLPAHLPFRLLAALARHPGALVTRRRLYPDLWENGWDRRAHDQHAALIRPLRTALGKVAAFPITSTAGDDDRGGWTLDLEAHEVAWWSEPPPFQQRNQQRKDRK